MNTEEFKIEEATRRGMVPIIGMYGGPGVGKTKSALLLARGIVGSGPKSDIVLIDTESRRGSFYADEIPGGYSTLNIDPPFSPLRYIAAMKHCVSVGAKVMIPDSMSHCWEGEGGVCDMADANEERSGKPGLHNWRKPKIEHTLMLQFMLRSPIPIICCMRAKQKTKIGRDERGKQVIKKDDYHTPITEADFAFELTTAIEIFPDHTLRFTKKSHAGLVACFPEGAPIEVKHGEAIAKWCASGGKPIVTPDTKAADPNAAIKSKLWELTKSKHGGKAENLEAYLKSANLIDPDASLSSMSAASLQFIVTAIEKEGLP